MTGQHIGTMLVTLHSMIWVVWCLTWPWAWDATRMGWNDPFSRFASHYFFEVRPFIPFLAVVGFIANAYSVGEVDWYSGAAMVVQIVCWWFARNVPDDRDRWKRRAQKATGRIVVVFNRLKVVPG